MWLIDIEIRIFYIVINVTYLMYIYTNNYYILNVNNSINNHIYILRHIL